MHRALDMRTWLAGLLRKRHGQLQRGWQILGFAAGHGRARLTAVCCKCLVYQTFEEWQVADYIRQGESPSRFLSAGRSSLWCAAWSPKGPPCQVGLACVCVRLVLADVLTHVLTHAPQGRLR